MRWHKPHVSSGDTDEFRYVSIASNGCRVPWGVVPDRRILTTKNGVSLLSYDASAWRTAFSISSGSYSGMAMEELVHRNLKKFMIAPKNASSEKAEQ